MAVEACSNLNMYEDEDDELPLVFKRTSGSSKQTQLNAEIKKSGSQNHDRKNTEVKKSPSLYQEKQGSGNHSHPNGQSSNGQKNNILPSAKRIPSKSPLSSPEASTSSGRALPVKSTSESSKGLSSPPARSKVTPQANPSVKAEKLSTPDSGDSEDEKPLISRYPSAVSKGSTNTASKGLSSSTPEPKVSAQPPADDSEDDLPLSSRRVAKSNASVSAGKSHASDERKPLASKLQQNGSVKREEQRKSPPFVNKRPLDKVNLSTQSSVKKPKLSDSSQVLKNKNVSIKSEQEHDDDDEDDVPISHRMKKASTSKNESLSGKRKATKVETSSIRKATKKAKMVAKNSNYSKSSKMLPSSGDGGQKWSTLVHNGVIFPPPYKPHGVKMLYNKKAVELTPEQEEVATMFAVMLDTEYAQKEKFVENFMADWRKILGKNHVIQNFKDCDFTPIYEWHQKEKEKKKQMSTEEKKAIKEEKLKLEEKYMWAVVDGVKEKVGNFRVEPPGLFRGRGEHPKMGKFKRRIYPSDITINIGKNAPIPECPIPGESWKEVRHDNTVTWLAYWTDPINQKEFKYVFLAPSSSLKGQSDKEKYEKARLLKNYIGGIRATYTKNFNSQNTTKRQIAVATYLIDKLALRAGNEKDDDEADTVGCCTLKVENVTLLPGTNTLRFDFLGKDSIRYEKDVEVEPLVYKAIRIFQQGKKPNEDLFDQLDTSKLNAHLKELMPGLTAKVFRTYNASITLDEMLNNDTKEGDVPEKVLTYQRANKEVAIICNHQRTVSKSHTAQISKLEEKIDELKKLVDELKTDLARAKKGKPPLKDADGKQKRNLAPEALQKKIDQTNGKIERLEQQKMSKEDLKTVALGTSKINYLDPRISVAWCKRHEVPIEKIFNKSLLAKFSWAMDVDPMFRF